DFWKRWQLWRYGFATLMVVGFAIAFSTGIARSQALESDIGTMLDQGKVSSAIAQIEADWETLYEDYFNTDFANYQRQTSEIAQILATRYQQTQEKAAAVWLVPLEDQLCIMLITPGQTPRNWQNKTVSAAQLDRTLADFRNRLILPVRRRTNSYLQPSQQLYTWLIEPMAEVLAAEDIDSLILCVGEGLRSLPFAALHDGQQFLIEKYNLSRVPAFNLTDFTATHWQQAQVLAMGASEFEELSSLPAVELEIAAITPHLWPGDILLNQDFTINNLIKQRQQQTYQIVHLATHAAFNPGDPDQSYIQFRRERLNFERLPQLQLSQPPLELLVLSACETAVGNREAELGFAGLAIQAGVKSAIASLWRVSDAGTMALMSEFYQQLQTAPTQAVALRQAQIAMLSQKVVIDRGELRTSRERFPLPPDLATNRDNLSHPFYWAGFSLIGSPW
ncbi:MAG: CHAT domain-containing protein, partial [Jaaginema sp. PMC 1079.18]|nr:CHAT domain-containing protein [Jaaginema sp. PMC 1079.18]